MFKSFSSATPLFIETKLFCLYLIFISSTVQRNHGGINKNFNFLLKKLHRPKNDFFRSLFFHMHIYLSRRNFLVITNFSYLQPFREIMEGQKALRTNNAQTNTTDDHNNPSVFIRILRLILTPPSTAYSIAGSNIPMHHN